MKKQNLIKLSLSVLLVIFILSIGIAFYLYNKPQRNISTSNTDYKLTINALVNEYLTNYKSANETYLATDGNSKILEITGTIQSISKNLNGKTVVLLKEADSKAGANCTLINPLDSTIHEGMKITLKGVIQAGVVFDSDLEMYQNAILDKCMLISNQ